MQDFIISQYKYNKRLFQIFIAVEITLCFLFILFMYEGDTYPRNATLSSMILLSPVWYFINKRENETGSLLLIIGLTVIVLALAWSNHGVRDEAIIGMPGILIFSALLGRTRLLLIILILMVVNLILMGLLSDQGLFEAKPATNTLTAAVTASGILLVISYAIWILSKDFSNALSDINLKNKTVERTQKKLNTLTYFDTLTGLPNRNLIKERFNHALKKSQRDKTIPTLLFIDIDNFKNINDSLGLKSGDDFLIEMSARILANLRNTDTVCRISGDEFVALIEDVKTSHDVELITEKLLQKIRTPLCINGKNISATASIGYAIAPLHGDSFDEALAKANMAVVKAKADGKNRIQIYEDKLGQETQYNFQLTNELKFALSRGEFELYYQPKIEIKSGRITGAEALLRWDNQQFGRVPPDMFIPLAETSGDINEIGQWVIEQACKECASWRDVYPYPVQVAVNISSIQFKKGNLEHIIKNALTMAKLPGSLLEVEFTESLFVEDSTHIMGSINTLKREGISLAIDDFGTGYSNLGYLKKFAINTLKIDQSFIRKISEDNQDKAIVKAIVQMADSLGLEVVAEGVETDDIVGVLKDLVCGIGQGYLWSKPVPASEFKEFLKQHIT